MEAVVVAGADRGEEGRRDGEERDVLRVGIMYRIVGHEVMNVVAALPPSQRKATAEIPDEDPNQGVDNVIVRNAPVSCVVCSKHNLLPEEA